MPFLNKVVLVTGASSGIGEMISLHFAKLNARLSLIDKDVKNLKITGENCEKLSRAKVLIIVADLNKDEHVKNAVNDTIHEYGRIDVVINCAGIYGSGSILDDDVVDTFDQIMATNLRSIVAVTNFAAPALVETKGCFVNISSVPSFVSFSACFAYNVAKAALNHFTKSVAYELASKGVRANLILPGPVKTNILINTGMDHSANDTFWDNMSASIPLKHNVKVEEVAELAAFLASEKARSMTGASYLIDGGYLLSKPQNV